MIFIFIGFVIVALLAYEIIYRRATGHLTHKQCPYCTDVIRYDATVCSTCLRTQPALFSIKESQNSPSRLISGELFFSSPC